MKDIYRVMMFILFMMGFVGVGLAVNVDYEYTDTIQIEENGSLENTYLWDIDELNYSESNGEFIISGEVSVSSFGKYFQSPPGKWDAGEVTQELNSDDSVRYKGDVDGFTEEVVQGFRDELEDSTIEVTLGEGEVIQYPRGLAYADIDVNKEFEVKVTDVQEDKSILTEFKMGLDSTEISLTEFDKYKELDVSSVDDGPMVFRAVPIKITSGDDSSTGTGEIELDWSDISSESDIGIYDENGNLLDYWFEDFDDTDEVATIHVYGDWVRDGSTQCQVAYGDGPSDQSVSASTVFDKEKDNSGLVSGWALNEDSGDALDLTSNDNDGTTSGGVTQGVIGIVDGAYDFDGNDDYVEIPNNDNLKPDRISSFAWIKRDSNDNNEYLYSHSNYVDDERGTSYRAKDNNNLQVVLNNDKSTSYDFNEEHGDIPVGEWVHVGFTYDGSEVDFYINGSNVGTDSFSGDLSDPDIDPRIGARAGDTEGPFDGFIDDVRVYDSALSSDEVKAKYDASKETPDFFSQSSGEDTSTLTVETDEATNIASDSATLHGELTDLGSSSEVDLYFKWREQGETTWNNELIESNVDSLKTYNYSLTGLNNETSYEFHAYVEDSSDSSFNNEGSILSFTTLEEPVLWIDINQPGNNIREEVFIADWETSEIDNTTVTYGEQTHVFTTRNNRIEFDSDSDVNKITFEACLDDECITRDRRLSYHPGARVGDPYERLTDFGTLKIMEILIAVFVLLFMLSIIMVK